MKLRNLVLTAALGLAGTSYGEALQMNVINRANADIGCAFGVYNAYQNQLTMYHWYTISNGGNYVFRAPPGTGVITLLRCESRRYGDGRVWARDNLYACVTRGANYVNPVFNAGNGEVCMRSGGEYQTFTRIWGTGNINWTVSP